MIDLLPSGTLRVSAAQQATIDSIAFTAAKAI
jgi:hypothetical protein